MGKIERRNAIIAVLAIALSACYGQPQAYVDSPALAATGDRLVTADASEPRIIAPIPPTQDPVPYQASAPYADAITLSEAISRSLRFSPAVQSAVIEIDAKHAETLQAGLRPNPELDGLFQNIGQNVQESGLELSQVLRT